MATLHQSDLFSRQPAEQFDLFCPACGYNLYGIPPRRCPECGFRYDRPALLDFTAGEVAARLHSRSAALVRGAYAIAFALPAVMWRFQSSALATFITVMFALCLAGLVRQACANGKDWSWFEDLWWQILAAVLLIGPAMVLTLLPLIGVGVTFVLLVDTLWVLWRASSPLPVIVESLPSPVQRQLRFYEAAGMMVWIVAVGMIVALNL
jgi:hypothetical protein